MHLNDVILDNCCTREHFQAIYTKGCVTIFIIIVSNMQFDMIHEIGIFSECFMALRTLQQILKLLVIRTFRFFFILHKEAYICFELYGNTRIIIGPGLI